MEVKTPVLTEKSGHTVAFAWLRLKLQRVGLSVWGAQRMEVKTPVLTEKSGHTVAFAWLRLKLQRMGRSAWGSRLLS